MKIDYLTWDKVTVEYEKAPPERAKTLVLDHMIVHFEEHASRPCRGLEARVQKAYRRATKRKILSRLRLVPTRRDKVGCDLLYVNPQLISMTESSMVWEAIWWSANFGATRFKDLIKARITCEF